MVPLWLEPEPEPDIKKWPDIRPTRIGAGYPVHPYSIGDLCPVYHCGIYDAVYSGPLTLAVHPMAMVSVTAGEETATPVFVGGVAQW